MASALGFPSSSVKVKLTSVALDRGANGWFPEVKILQVVIWEAVLCRKVSSSSFDPDQVEGKGREGKGRVDEKREICCGGQAHPFILLYSQIVYFTLLLHVYQKQKNSSLWIFILTN